MRELRSFISIASKAGKPKTQADIARWSAQIDTQSAAKQASKPASQQLRHVEQGVQRLEKQLAKLEQATTGYVEAAAAAQRTLGDRFDKAGSMQADIVRAKLRKDELAKKLAASATSPSSPDLLADVWPQLHVASKTEGVEAALAAIPGDFGIMLVALLNRAAAEAEARQVAKIEAEANAAAATATATPATTTTATAPTVEQQQQQQHEAAPSKHPFAPPAHPNNENGEKSESDLLHASRTSWPHGNVAEPRPVPVTCHSSLSDEQIAMLTAATSTEATAEQRAAVPAILERLRANRSSPY